MALLTGVAGQALIWSARPHLFSLALLRRPDVFAAAAASSPATDWRNYDTIYTERYMGIPQENQEGYDAASAMTYAKDLKGRLLLYYGSADNNVHPSNSLQLIKALQDAGKSFDVQVGPDRFIRLGWPATGHGDRFDQVDADHFRFPAVPQEQDSSIAIRLGQLIDDPDMSVRKEAANTLEAFGHIGPLGPHLKAAVPGLVRGILGTNTDVRLAVMEALDAFGVEIARPAVPALADALNPEISPDAKVREAAARTLDRFGPRALVDPDSGKIDERLYQHVIGALRRAIGD